MRKYLIGFFCGSVLVSSTAVYASESIKAILFPVTFEVNGIESELPSGYHTLNVEGRTYVPIRYAAESLDAVVAYDHAEKKIRIDNNYRLTSINSDIRAGHIEVVKDGASMKVTGKLYAGQSYWEAMYGSKIEIKPGSIVEISADIVFYNDAGKVLGNVPITIPIAAEGDQIKEFEVTTDVNIKGYSFVTLQNVNPEPIYAFLPPNLRVTDANGDIGLGIESVKKSGEFTKLLVSLGVLKKGSFRYEAVVTFYDGAGEVLGTAEVNAVGNGLTDVDKVDNVSIVDYHETAGKGDFTQAAKYTLTLNEFEVVDADE